jgi:hypothetical protein
MTVKPAPFDLRATMKCAVASRPSAMTPTI